MWRSSFISQLVAHSGEFPNLSIIGACPRKIQIPDNPHDKEVQRATIMDAQQLLPVAPEQSLVDHLHEIRKRPMVPMADVRHQPLDHSFPCDAVDKFSFRHVANPKNHYLCSASLGDLSGLPFLFCSPVTGIESASLFAARNFDCFTRCG